MPFQQILAKFPAGAARRIGTALAALLLLVSAQLTAEVRSLTILHTNDLHARLSPLEDHHGGFAYVAAVIRHERAHCTDCILLNAGDIAQGSPASTIFHGLPEYEIANLFGFDVSTLGNHEFDWGWEQTRKFLETAKFPTVTANVVDDSGRALGLLRLHDIYWGKERG